MDSPHYLKCMYTHTHLIAIRNTSFLEVVIFDLEDFPQIQMCGGWWQLLSSESKAFCLCLKPLFSFIAASHVLLGCVGLGLKASDPTEL